MSDLRHRHAVEAFVLERTGDTGGCGERREIAVFLYYSLCYVLFTASLNHFISGSNALPEKFLIYKRRLANMTKGKGCG
jgi:hypothetical protein